MAWSVTVKRLVEELRRFPDDAIVMVANGPREEADAVTYELDEDITSAYRNDEGEIFTDMEVDDGESVARATRVVVLWPVTE